MIDRSLNPPPPPARGRAWGYAYVVGVWVLVRSHASSCSTGLHSHRSIHSLGCLGLRANTCEKP
ncbi:hypothetical protein XACLG98_990001 [Xanthomonas citri pv. citri]|nr:hypothetical protein XACLG98_990001 [Xanthomonas citri pv. citri]